MRKLLVLFNLNLLFKQVADLVRCSVFNLAYFLSYNFFVVLSFFLFFNFYFYFILLYNTVLVLPYIMGREMGGEFMFGNTCTPMVDSCQLFIFN